jgi:hypothetical protein
MKQHYFVKFDRRVNQVIGCQRATLIFNTLEYWFSKKQEGFYKFIEPCSHPLYKKGDSWTEELNCDRKSFSASFKKIGVRYKSRTAFEEAEDKFQGKMFASIYDRNSNRMFFIRNDEEVTNFFAGIYTPQKHDEPQIENKENSQSNPKTDLLKNLLRNGKVSRSYKDAKSSSRDLSKDKSHAEEIVKKMIEIWTAVVEEGREQVKLGRTTIPFLKKAFADKFDSCLEKWKKFCHDIASSRFLMGEKTSFKAKLDWALMFKNIEKILDGQYGVGDRTPKAILPSQSDLQEEILSSGETQEVKDFRALCLETVGTAIYISYFKKLTIEFREEGEVALIDIHKFGADFLKTNHGPSLHKILHRLGENTKRISLLAPGETQGRLIERERGGDITSDLPSVSPLEHSTPEELFEEEVFLQEEALTGISLETKALREKLRKTIPPRQFPAWLAEIKVESIQQNGTVIVNFQDRLMVDYCKARFTQHILACAKELWQDIKYIVIQEKSPDLKDLGSASLQSGFQGTENSPECLSMKNGRDSFNMAESEGEGGTLKDGTLPGLFLETQALRTKLRNIIPPQQFPGWLSDIEVEDIGQEGTIVVTFRDQLIVDYCIARFSQEILQSATSLWEEVNKVDIRQKLALGVCLVEKPLKPSENVEKTEGKSMLEKVVHSLLPVFSPATLREPLRTKGTLPDFSLKGLAYG